jgi:hypothetical protein
MKKSAKKAHTVVELPDMYEICMLYPAVIPIPSLILEEENSPEQVVVYRKWRRRMR